MWVNLSDENIRESEPEVASELGLQEWISFEYGVLAEMSGSF